MERRTKEKMLKPTWTNGPTRARSRRRKEGMYVGSAVRARVDSVASRSSRHSTIVLSGQLTRVNRYRRGWQRILRNTRANI